MLKTGTVEEKGSLLFEILRRNGDTVSRFDITRIGRIVGYHEDYVIKCFRVLKLEQWQELDKGFNTLHGFKISLH